MPDRISGELAARVPPIRRAGAWLAWWILLMSFWVILDDSLATDELLAGAGAAALGATLAELVGNQSGLRLRVRIEWLRPALRLPAQVARDTWIVFGALWRRVAHGEEPGSGFVAVAVRQPGATAGDRSWRALEVWRLSSAPNSFALGIDQDREVVIAHQLVRPEADR
jgi:hypothetical protein